MSRIRGRDTGPERLLAAMITNLGVVAELHVRSLPGRPDFAFWNRKVAVFVDGDFWHGWRFSAWRRKLTPFWAEKISGNRARDVRNHCRLRRMGWKVLRVWEHQIERDPDRVMSRLRSALFPVM